MPMPDEVVAKTAAGQLRGEIVAGVCTFRGVPYARDTGGSGRFRPPRPAHPWSGIRDALAFGPIAPQVVSPPGRGNAESGELLGDSFGLRQSEDCLSLNVWTPGMDDGQRPVMVWFHGGGYTGGSGQGRTQWGDALSRRGDVVVVTVNHRLGILGYLDLSRLGGEYESSGVAGVQDLVAALEWVRDNIQEFGGNPYNVTIFGVSGGGAKVATLLVMPAARGLFHRAIVHSGMGLLGITRQDAGAYTDELLRELGWAPDQAQGLLDVPFERLVAAQASLRHDGVVPGQPPGTPVYGAGTGNLQLGPVIGVKELPAHPLADSKPPMVDVPLIIGGTKDEMGLYWGLNPGRRELSPGTSAVSLPGADMDDAEMLARAIALLGEPAHGLVETYREARPREAPSELLISIMSDVTRMRSIHLAERKLQLGGTGPVFMFLFCWESPMLGGKLKACHALDVPFVFDNVAQVPLTGGSTERFELAADMSRRWATFARTGAPGGEQPDWPAYSVERRETMLFDCPSRVECDPRADERLAWRQYFASIPDPIRPR
jgi:para-nitrobenzyl esterase